MCPVLYTFDEISLANIHRCVLTFTDVYRDSVPAYGWFF